MSGSEKTKEEGRDTTQIGTNLAKTIDMTHSCPGSCSCFVSLSLPTSRCQGVPGWIPPILDAPELTRATSGPHCGENRLERMQCVVFTVTPAFSSKSQSLSSIEVHSV